MNFHGAVINQTSTFITVSNSNPNHQNELRTFTFSPQLKPKMQRILDAGGYQRGDKVVVTSNMGSNVALNVRGRRPVPVRPGAEEGVAHGHERARTRRARTASRFPSRTI